MRTSSQKQPVDQETEIRLRELALKEREQNNRDEEAIARRAQLASSKWTSPVFVALLAASVAGIGNGVVAVVNGRQNRNLEEIKSESERILEVIKTGGDTEKAAENLKFLVQAGLINDPVRVKKLIDYLAKRTVGSGPSLPIGDGKANIKAISNVSSVVQADLRKRISSFVVYLKSIGLDKVDANIPYNIDEKIDWNAYFSPEKNQIFIGPQLVTDQHAPLTVLAEAALYKYWPSMKMTDQYLVLDIAVSDYYASSFLNDPKVGQIAAAIFKQDKGYLRNINNNFKYTDITSGKISIEPHDASQVWSGLFWALRNKIGQNEVDKLLANTWKSMPNPQVGHDIYQDFLRNMVSVSEKNLTQDQAIAVRNTIIIRGFPDDFNFELSANSLD